MFYLNISLYCIYIYIPVGVGKHEHDKSGMETIEKLGCLDNHFLIIG